MKWWMFWVKTTPLPVEDDEGEGLALARAQRLAAESQLRRSRMAARQVREVTIESRTLRNDNQFSDRLSQAFGSRPQNG